MRSHTPWLSFISFRPLNGTHRPQSPVCHPRIAQSSPEGFMRCLWLDLSLTPGVSVMLYDPWNRPCRCWCFESWHCFSSASVLSLLSSKGWAMWGWWPVTEREEIWLSTLSGCQLEWRTMEQVTPLGRLVPGPPSPICFPYLSYCHDSNDWFTHREKSKYFIFAFGFFQRFSTHCAVSPSSHH